MLISKSETMTLIKSISGIRGTIGGEPGQNLTPLDAVQFAAAYARWLRDTASPEGKNIRVVIGRDARPSGPILQALVQNTLLASGLEVIDLGPTTTPTVEMAVVAEEAQGGIILTASHNPVEWNALKLLNHRGEFISAEDGQALLALIDQAAFDFVPVQELGTVREGAQALEEHLDAILALPYVDVEAIRAADLYVSIDAVNSTGGIALPRLLERLGVSRMELLYCEPNGRFPHNPEPLAQHLGEIMQVTHEKGCDLGLVVDPDVDRLALIDEQGQMFGEEYTLVAAADYLLQQRKGPVVSNLSSSRALRNVAEKHGTEYHASAVGEVNVVATMKAVGAVIGGEGNGGVILPELHYGRDALVGVALILSYLAKSGKKLSDLRREYPAYFMAKNKAQLTPDMDVDQLLAAVAQRYQGENVNTIDGVKIDFTEKWVHLRKSNTEPIIRIYTEAQSQEEADALAGKFTAELESLAKQV